MNTNQIIINSQLVICILINDIIHCRTHTRIMDMLHKVIRTTIHNIITTANTIVYKYTSYILYNNNNNNNNYYYYYYYNNILYNSIRSR